GIPARKKVNWRSAGPTKLPRRSGILRADKPKSARKLLHRHGRAKCAYGRFTAPLAAAPRHLCLPGACPRANTNACAPPSWPAVLAANMETALNAVWDAAPGPADRIAVVGAGVVGSLVGYLCGQLPGAEVTLVDVNPARAELARCLGVSFAMAETAKGDCDLVVHASGNAAGHGTALALAGEEATVLELSWYGNAPVTMSLGGAFHTRRLRLLSSQVGGIAPSHRPRWTHGRRLAAALNLLADDRLEVLLAPAVSFQDLA